MKATQRALPQHGLHRDRPRDQMTFRAERAWAQPGSLTACRLSDIKDTELALSAADAIN